MSKYTEHLAGLAELEDNIGKKVAFESSAKMIAELEKELAELKASLPKVRADAVRDAISSLSIFESVLYPSIDAQDAIDYANQLEQGNE